MISAQTFTEVYEILKKMDKETVMKIPIDVLNNIKKKRDLNFETKIDSKDIFNPENVSKETIKILNWIDINYWMNEIDKEKLLKKFNIIEFEKNKLKEKNYNPDNLFSEIKRKKENK